jgi:hypothetical protein
MPSNIVLALRAWMRATLWPRKVIAELQERPDKIAIAFWINFIFALLYSITALIYYAIGRLPAFPPWIPLPEESYSFSLMGAWISVKYPLMSSARKAKAGTPQVAKTKALLPATGGSPLARRNRDLWYLLIPWQRSKIA